MFLSLFRVYSYSLPEDSFVKLLFLYTRSAALTLNWKILMTSLTDLLTCSSIFFQYNFYMGAQMMEVKCSVDLGLM